MQATIYNLAGEEVEKIDLDDAIFGIEPNHAVIHQAVLRQQANARQGTHDTKTRADVRGGGKKPWRQKGTGRARQGSTRSPQFRHGGVVFGPHPRSYEQDMPRKARRLAIRSVLSGKMADGQLVLVDSFAELEPRTKAMIQTLNNLNVGENSALIFTTGEETTLKMAAGNLSRVKMQSAHLLSVVDMLKHDFVVIPRAALDVVTGILGNMGGRRKLVLKGVATPSANGKAAEAAAPTAEAEPEAETPKAAPKKAAAKKTTKAEAKAETEAAKPSIVRGDVVIAEVHYKGDESVQLRNDNDLPVDLGGWVIRDQHDHDQSFTFPEGTELKPGSTLRVFTAPGHKLSFESKRPIWNDQGDVAELVNLKGKVVSTFAYGKYAEDKSEEKSEG